VGLFKSKRQREFEADLQVRQSKARIQRFIRQVRSVQKRYWDLGKLALRLGDREQFTQLASALVRARDQANYWERYLLQLETLSARREEVAATGEFIKGISALTTSILRGASPEQIAAMQGKLEQALVRADALQELLAVALDGSADRVFGVNGVDEQGLDALAGQMTAESQRDDGASYDERIAQSLKQIEDQMRHELTR